MEGFDTPFVRNYVLPEWWDDMMSVNPATRSMAEVYISRMIGISVQSLRNPAVPLQSLHDAEFRLKRNKNVTVDKLRPAIMLSQSLASILVKSLNGLPNYRPGHEALNIRREILAKRTSVDLTGLLEWAWEHGIIVVHLKQLPQGTKNLIGVAMCFEDRPVIVLAGKSDSPPWLAFHLAHELGHIVKNHVLSGQTLLDDKINWLQRSGEATQEKNFEQCEVEANEFALFVLTANPALRFEQAYGLTAQKLAAYARAQEDVTGINAGTLALIYGYTASRMGVAQNALKQLELYHGAHKLIADMAKLHLPDDISEALSAFLPLIDCE
jgi:Zn-dependent peptidase ImmA (M78 family)